MKKLLIVKTSSMGDIIHTLPAITDAAAHFRDLTFDWVIEEGFAEIPTWHPAINNVIPIALRRWRKQILDALKHHEPQAFLHNLRNSKYDYIIDAQGLIKSALIGLLAKGKIYGYAADSIKEPLAAFSYHRKFHISKQQHAITRIRQLFAMTLGYKAPDSLPNYGIDKSKFNPSKNTQKKYLVFIHATSNPAKCWQEAKWAELANLIGNDFIIKLPWGNKEEQQRAERIANECINAEVLPKMNLSEIAALLCYATGVVTMDTGLGHLAAALDTPTISLYGKTDPALIGTIGGKTAHITDFNNATPKNVLTKLQIFLFPS